MRPLPPPLCSSYSFILKGRKSQPKPVRGADWDVRNKRSAGSGAVTSPNPARGVSKKDSGAVSVLGVCSCVYVCTWSCWSSRVFGTLSCHVCCSHPVDAGSPKHCGCVLSTWVREGEGVGGEVCVEGGGGGGFCSKRG